MTGVGKNKVWGGELGEKNIQLELQEAEPQLG